MPTETLNVGLIGAGRIGRLHAEHLVTRIPAARLLMIADVNEELARQCAQQLGVAGVAGDYLALLERKPGSLDNARPFKQHEWGEELASMRKELEYRQPGGPGTRQFIEILQLALAHPMEALQRAVGVCVNRRVYSVAAVINVLGNEPRRAAPRLDLSGRDELCGVGEGMRPLAIYDRLRIAEGGACAAEGSADGPSVMRVAGACPELACGDRVEAAEGMVLS